MHFKSTLISSLTVITLLAAPLSAQATYKFGDITKCVVRNIIKAGKGVACLVVGQNGPVPIEQAQRFLAIAELEEHLQALQDLLTAMNTQTTALATTGSDIEAIKSLQSNIDNQKKRIKVTEEVYWDEMVAEDPEIQTILAKVDAKTQAAAGSKIAKITTKAEKVAAVLSFIPSNTVDKVTRLLKKGIAHGKARQDAALEEELSSLNADLEAAQQKLKEHLGDISEIDVRNATAKQAYGLSMQLLNGYIARGQEDIVEKTGNILAAQKLIVDDATPNLEAENTEITLKLRGAKCPDITTAGTATTTAIAACKTSILSENFPAHATCATLSPTSTSAQIKACIVGLDG